MPCRAARAPRLPGRPAGRWAWRWPSLAVACVVVGFAAGPVVGAIAGVAAEPWPGAPSARRAGLRRIPVDRARCGLRGRPRSALLLVGVAGSTWLVGVRRRKARRVPTWTCGIAPEPAFEYTATSYAKLIRLYFGPILRPAREISVELHPGTPFPRTVRYRGEVSHVIDERLYGPLHRAAVGAAQLVRRLQSGSLQLYLAYAVAALIVLLLVAR